MTKKFALCAVVITWLIVMAALAFSALYGAQEPYDPEAGKPASCDNYARTAPVHRCACGKAMHAQCDQPAPSVRNDSKCATNCKPEHCHCVSQCQTHH